MKPLLPAFSLRDRFDRDRSFPDGRPALIVMVKHDCPTCGIVMPLLEALHRGLCRWVDALVVGQTKEDREHKPAVRALR
jgi:hypothetical protein